MSFIDDALSGKKKSIFNEINLPEPELEPEKVSFIDKALALTSDLFAPEKKEMPESTSVPMGIFETKTGLSPEQEKNLQFEGTPSPGLFETDSGRDPVRGMGVKPERLRGLEFAVEGMKDLPETAAQMAGGGLQFLGSKDNIMSPQEKMNQINETLKRKDLGFWDNVVATYQGSLPALGIRLIADKVDEARAGIMENITFGKGKQDERIPLAKVLKDIGMNMGDMARESREKDLPKDMTTTEQGLYAGTQSAGQMLATGGLLGLVKLFNAGAISTAFAGETFLQVYDETLAETGDEQKAFANAAFSGVVEKVTELPAAKILTEKLGGKILPVLAQYLAVEYPSEVVAEVLQDASAYVNSKEGENKTVSEVFNRTLERIPDIAKTTAVAVAVGGTSTLAAFKTVNSTLQAYDKMMYTWKKNQFDKNFQAIIEQEWQNFDNNRNALVDDIVNRTASYNEAREELLALGRTVEKFTGDPYFGQVIAVNTLGPTDVYSGAAKQGLENLVISDETGSRNLNTIQPVGVHFATTGKYQVAAVKARKKLTNAKLNLDTVKADPQVSAETLQKAETEVKIATIAAQSAEADLTIFNNIKDEIIPFVQYLQKTYLPQNSVIVNDYSYKSKTEVGGRYGSMLRDSYGNVILSINPQAFLKGIKWNENGTVKSFDNKKLAETTAHEFGHALASEWFNRLPENVQKVVYKGYDAYRQKMANMRDDKTKTAVDIYGNTRGAATAKSEMQKMMAQKTPPSQVSAANLMKLYMRHRTHGIPSTAPAGAKHNKANTFFNYVMSFDEWFAHEMETTVLGHSEINKAAQNVIKSQTALLKRFHDRAKQTYRPSETFSALLNYIKESVSMEQAFQSIELMEKATDQPEGGIKTQSEMEQVSFAMDKIHKLVKEPSDAVEFNIDDLDPKASMDKYNGFMKNVLTLTQIAKENSHIAELQKYVEMVERWWAEKSKWNEKALESIEAWQNLGKDQADRLAKFALAVTLKSDDLGRALTVNELNDLNQQRQHQLDGDAFAVWEQIDQDFKDALGYDPFGSPPKGLYKALILDIKRTHAANPEKAMEALQVLEKEMLQLHNRNFFPLSRFGRYKILLKATGPVTVEGVRYEKGENISFETFEDTTSQIKRAEELRSQLSGKSVKILPGIMDDTQFAYAGMPPNLVKALRNQLDLSAEQREQLDTILLEQTTAARFKKHLLKRAGTPGFSSDAMRGYASYMAHFANAAARMEFAPFMQEQITALENSIGTIQNQGTDIPIAQITKEANKRQRMISYLKEHFEYVMNPGNELANLRSAAFLVYMGLLPKSAFVNLSQVPMVAWPYMSSKIELGGSKLATGTEAGVAIAKATLDIGNIFKGKEAKFTPQELEMFEELVRRGILDESLAQELGALAEGSNLQRMLPESWSLLRSKSYAKAIRNASYVGAYMFHNAERFNRRVTALASFRLAMKHGAKGNMQKAISLAHETVRDTQYEYARWNRPAIMRGKKSIIFMFKMYLEGTLYHIARQPGGRKTVLAFLLMAGVSGLPGAEDAMDMYNFLANLWNKHFGDKGARASAEEEIRAIAKGLNLDPNLAMHGLGHKYGLGPIHLLELAGIPIPNVDTSGSLSLGRVVPGLGPMLQLDNPDPMNQLGRASSEAAGAVVAIPISWYKALTSDDPNTWKNVESALPNAMKYWSQGLRFAVNGKETRRDGSTLQTFDLSNPLDVSKIALHAMGFPGTQMNEQKELDWSIREARMFFETRRGILMNQFAKAVLEQDREGIADAKKAIQSYNESVPFPSLSISGKTLNQSVRSKQRNRTMNEQNLGTTRKNVPQALHLQELYPVTEENVK